MKTGDVVQWIVFEIVAFYVNIAELTVQSVLYSTQMSAIEFIYNIKLVTRIQTLFHLKAAENHKELEIQPVIINDNFKEQAQIDKIKEEISKISFNR